MVSQSRVRFKPLLSAKVDLTVVSVDRILKMLVLIPWWRQSFLSPLHLKYDLCGLYRSLSRLPDAPGPFVNAMLSDSKYFVG